MSYARSSRPVKLRSGCHPVAYRLPATEARSENIIGTRGWNATVRSCEARPVRVGRCTGTRWSQFARFSPRQSTPSPAAPAA